MTIDDTRRKWLALYVLCLGDLLIVLDISIVNVALPSIRTTSASPRRRSRGSSTRTLLTFGGFMLLARRLGDLFGHRRVFVARRRAVHDRVGLLRAAELARRCSSAARAVQGLGGAVVAAVALSLIMTLFTEPADRAKAMGVIGFVAAGGGSDRRPRRRRPHRSRSAGTGSSSSTCRSACVVIVFCCRLLPGAAAARETSSTWPARSP
jgi:MFS family permease